MRKLVSQAERTTPEPMPLLQPGHGSGWGSTPAAVPACESIPPLHARTALAECHSGQSQIERFGCVTARQRGLATAPTIAAMRTRDARLAISYLCCGHEPGARDPATLPEDTFVLILHLAEPAQGVRRYSGNDAMPASGCDDGTMRILNPMDGNLAVIGSPLNPLSIKIPRTTLDKFTDEAGLKRLSDNACVSAATDPVLAGLGAALLPAMKHPTAASALVVESIGWAVLAHVATSLSGLALVSRRSGGLTKRQEDRAKRYLAETDASELSLAEAAATCGLSRSYFSKAFKATMGCTPSRWLLEHRIGKAKRLLRARGSIAEIAMECGFTDQSHFTRMFTHVVGKPPGVWRRQGDCHG